MSFRTIIVMFLLMTVYVLRIQAQTPVAVLVFDGEEMILQQGGNTVELGDIRKGGNAGYHILVQNKSGKFFHMSNVRGSCGLSIPSWPRNGIEPGQEAMIHFRLDTSRLGKIERNITMYGNARQPRYSLSINADIVPVL